MKEGKAYKYAVWCSTEQEGKVPEYVKNRQKAGYILRMGMMRGIFM